MKEALINLIVCLELAIFYGIVFIACLVVMIVDEDWLLGITVGAAALAFVGFTMGVRSAINEISDLYTELKNDK